jgi:Predicted solute binding protein
MRTPKSILLIVLMLAFILCIGCEYPNATKEDAMTDAIGSDDPSPTKTDSKSASPSTEATASPSLTESPGENNVRDLPQDTLSSTPTPSNTPSPSPKPTNTPSPKPTKTPTPRPTSTPTPKPIKLTGKLDTSEGDYYVFYVVNINTGKFHRPKCRHVKKMYESNTNYATEHGFADAESARNWLIKQSYDTCGTCSP